MIFETTVKFCDADSGVMIDYCGNEKMFRLIDTKAPGKGQPGYKTAKKVVTGMVGRYNGVVTVEINNGMDSYHRLLVLMFNPDGCINSHLIEKGYH
jgi:hypothetical protein